MHLFGRYCDHDYQFELLSEEERGAHSITRCSTAHHGDFRAAPRAKRTRRTADNPILGASSNRDRQPVVAPWRPWRSSCRAASSGESIGCAIPADCALLPVPPPPAGNARSTTAWLNSAIVGFNRSSISSRSRRRRLAHGANWNDSSCCRSVRHNRFLHRRPSFRATALREDYKEV
jgi:hypothetical protein